MVSKYLVSAIEKFTLSRYKKNVLRLEEVDVPNAIYPSQKSHIFNTPFLGD